MRYYSEACCGHCDSFHEWEPDPQIMTRWDTLRGQICATCDEVLDEMLGEVTE